MKDNFIQTVKKVCEYPKKLQKLLKMNSPEEIHRLFQENGYGSNLDEFKKDLFLFANKSGLISEEDLEFDNVSGGVGLKSNLMKSTAAALS